MGPRAAIVPWRVRLRLLQLWLLVRLSQRLHPVAHLLLLVVAAHGHPPPAHPAAPAVSRSARQRRLCQNEGKGRQSRDWMIANEHAWIQLFLEPVCDRVTRATTAIRAPPLTSRR